MANLNNVIMKAHLESSNPDGNEQRLNIDLEHAIPNNTGFDAHSRLNSELLPLVKLREGPTSGLEIMTLAHKIYKLKHSESNTRESTIPFLREQVEFLVSNSHSDVSKISKDVRPTNHL